MSTAEDVAVALGGNRSGSGWMARCPCHRDDKPSLSIREAGDGKVLLKCHAGCSQDELVAKCRDLGLDLSGRCRDGSSRIVGKYDYCNRNGELRYQVIRLEPKGFRQRRPDSKGGWIWAMEGVKPLPYRLPEMLAEPNKLVFVVEGEKDADRLAKSGLIATTNAGGAGKFKDEIARWFRDRDVVIVPDNDEPGRKHAADVAHRLRDEARRIRIVELPGLPPKGDVSDWLHWQGGGHDWKDLSRLVEQTPDWNPDATDPPTTPKPSEDDEARPPEYSDDALALRFSTAHGGDARHVTLWGKWLLWTGACWQFDDTMRAFDMARSICRAASVEIGDTRGKLAAAVASARTVAAIVSLSRSDRRHAVATDQFDRDPMIFNAEKKS
jgi:putative DNA primase/helicase